MSERGWSTRVRFIEFWGVIVFDFLASKDRCLRIITSVTVLALEMTCGVLVWFC